MGFEESMIEAGFHDEEKYLEYLMEEFENQDENQQFCDDDSDNNETEEYYEGDDYLEEECKKYYAWCRNNPIKKELLVVWAYTFFESEKENEYFFVNRFLEWEQREKECIEQLKEYWGDKYEELYSFIVWKNENPMEEILRQPQHEYFDFRYDPPLELPESDIIDYDLEDFKYWIKRKQEFDSWINNATEDKKKEFFDEIDYNEFNNDKSIENIRLCIERQLNDDKELDYTKQKVMSWYDTQPEKASKLFYYIKCVQYY